MAQRVEALVEPSLLVWAREKAGYDVERAAAKAGVSVDRLSGWEQGLRRPTIAQLRDLGRIYKRPIAVFYLPEPPQDFPPIKDFRVAWERNRHPPSPELLGEIEDAHARRLIAVELLEDEDERPAVFRLRASLDDDPDDVAQRFRRALGVSVEDQATWADTRMAFNAWRGAAEGLGVLVGQMTGIAQSEARGFSIDKRPLPVVVANNRDPFGARSFTIVHELAHLAIREAGICDLASRVGRVEPFCNHVAGAALVPGKALLADEVVRAHGDDASWQDTELVQLARRFSVSREVVLRRLLILGRTDDVFYRRKRRELLAEYERRGEAEDQKTWGPSPATVALARAGRYFSRLVLNRYYDGAITGSDVAAYLGVRMKHIPRIEQSIFGAPQ